MVRGDGLYFINPLRGDESPSLGERLKAVFQSESHAFEQTAVDHVGEWMTIEDSMKIGDEGQSSLDLSETSKEDPGARHLRTG